MKWVKWKNYIVSKGGKCTINTNGNSVQSCECNLYNTRCSEWLSWVKFNGVGGCARAKHAWEEVKRWTLTCQQTRQSRALFEPPPRLWALQAPKQERAVAKNFSESSPLSATDRQDCPKALLGHWPPYKTTINIPSFVRPSLLLSQSLTWTVLTPTCIQFSQIKTLHWSTFFFFLIPGPEIRQLTLRVQYCGRWHLCSS